MSERNIPAHQLKEGLVQSKKTQLSMIVDPPNQAPGITTERVGEFLQEGGSAVLVGGSGFIEPEVFNETLDAVLQVTSGNPNIPVWILPGDLRQIPKRNDGIAGVLNYVDILGSQGNFEEAYPRRAREYVAATLTERQIPSIRTLYVLCGDPNASVSQVSGILPLELSLPLVREQLASIVRQHFINGVDCLFFEAGSNSLEPANRAAVVLMRDLIDAISPSTTLVVSGGIRTPDQAKQFAGIAHYVNIGGHFERNGTHNTADFVRAIS